MGRKKNAAIKKQRHNAKQRAKQQQQLQPVVVEDSATVEQKLEEAHDRHDAFNRWLMGISADHGRVHVTKWDLDQWEIAELTRINKRRRDKWDSEKHELGEHFSPLTYLPDSAYEACRLMGYVR
jgi:hypothetical protein